MKPIHKTILSRYFENLAGSTQKAVGRLIIHHLHSESSFTDHYFSLCCHK